MSAEATPKAAHLNIVRPATPDDAADMEELWLDPGLGDGITDTHQDKIPIGKPRNFFRVHPDKAFRRRTELYVHKTEDAIDEQYYIVAPSMRGQILEARPCVLVPCIYRDGSLRLWPIMSPRPGEKDNSAWSSARKAARAAIDGWVRLVWVAKSYEWRESQPGYAPDPDWSKVPALQRNGEACHRRERHHP